MLDMMVHAVTAPYAALWAALSAVLGFMVGAVAAHPFVAAVGALYLGGWVWFVRQVTAAPTEP